jgi:predicted RNA binding protein YcfA (HicA-like mRNA interferase family)
LKHVSGQAFCKALERAGWVYQRTTSSHRIYTRPGRPLTISVPVHGNQTLKSGTQRSLMRQAGLTDADFSWSVTLEVTDKV